MDRGRNLLILCILPILLSFTIFIDVFADTYVSIPEGTSVLGCEETNECYIPADILIVPHETVTWSNDDTAAHTVTSVDSSGSPNGVFDSSLFMAGTTYSHTFSNSGAYDYVCMVHPWMQGTVVVADINEPPEPTPYVEPITVTTDKSSYREGETIVISGHVGDILSGFPISLQIFGPDGNLMALAELHVRTNGDYETEITAGGQMIDAGTYTVKVLYGSEARTAETTFYFFGKPASSPTSSSINVEGYYVSYKISRGNVLSITPDIDARSVIVNISTTSNGQLTITLPRELIDAKFSNGADDRFFVLVDGKEVPYDETKNSSSRTLTIFFPTGAEEIEIIGTFVISGYSPPPSYTPPTYNPPSTIPSGVDVVIPRGTSVLGCEENNACYDPYQIRVGKGSTVTWYNADNAAHTVTSGTSDNGPDGEFDSNMFMAGTSFSQRFDDTGTYPYFCMLHPWMTGYVIVERGGPVYSDPITITPRDSVPPKILKPTDVIVDAENQNGARVTYEVLAIDDTDEIVRPSCSPSSGSLFSVGDTRVTCNAMDSSGNRAQQVSFTVTVNPPGISIPNWVKNVAEFWCDDKIDDASFIEGIQYLIDNNIIIVTQTTAGITTSQAIPDWVKNNACWWSQGLIADEDFASGIQFLIKIGVIRI